MTVTLEQVLRGLKARTCPTRFGQAVDLDLPEGTTAIIVSVNSGQGYQPKRLLLPHQLYVDTIRKLLADNPGTRAITVHPIRSSESVDVYGGF